MLWENLPAPEIYYALRQLILFLATRTPDGLAKAGGMVPVAIRPRRHPPRGPRRGASPRAHGAASLPSRAGPPGDDQRRRRGIHGRNHL